MYSLSLYIFIFGLGDAVLATPRNRIRSSVPSFLVEGPVTTTITISGMPTDAANKPNMEALGQPIDANSFFWISNECYSDTRNMKGTGFSDRAAFYTQACKDATVIADQARKWPVYGIDASNTYFGKDVEGDAYAPNIIANIKAAAEWDNPRWGFDNYIILTCDDPYQACKRHIGDDPRPIGCYVNNTRSWFWNKSAINCCETFFTTSTIDQQFEYNRNVDPKQLDLRYLQTGGSCLLHEMMHTLEITGTNNERPHIVDQEFDGTSKRRIYGPKYVAKAARDLSPMITTLNADSYAQFAAAIFWKDIFGEMPRPETGRAAPLGYTELITDNDLNYVRQELPLPPQVCAGTPATNPSVQQPFAQATIATFCDYLVESNIVVDSGKFKYNPVGYHAGDSQPESDNDLWLSVTFDPLCNPKTTYKITKDECNLYLGITLNGCNTDSMTAKYGGEVHARCAIWNMTTRFGHDDKPPKGFTGLEKRSVNLF